MPGQRTYWHLAGLGRKPSDYEIATSRLLYHPQQGFEVAVPLADWYARYQRGSPLQCCDWERFHDPRETTYSSYTARRHEAEMYVDGILRSIDETGYDARLDPAWCAVLEATLPTLRYPVHGLQMVAAYVGQMAPCGRITITAALQTADEIRRVQRYAYRMCQLQQTWPGFGEQARARWEQSPPWQPLRELIERLLVTWDWGEALVALNLVVKPAFDGVLMTRFAGLARRAGDDRDEALCLALEEDCRWHRQWTAALLQMACADRPENRDAIAAWFEAWLPRTLQALAALLPALMTSSQQQTFDPPEWIAEIEGRCRRGLAECLAAEVPPR